MIIVKPSVFDVNEEDDYGMTPLHYAARNGHVDVCEFLLDRGVMVVHMASWISPVFMDQLLDTYDRVISGDLTLVRDVQLY